MLTAFRAECLSDPDLAVAVIDQIPAGSHSVVVDPRLKVFREVRYKFHHHVRVGQFPFVPVSEPSLQYFVLPVIDGDERILFCCSPPAPGHRREPAFKQLPALCVYENGP